MGAERCGKSRAAQGKIILLAAGIFVCICGCGGAAAETGAETELKAGQRKAQVRVISITGNELTYMELETEAGVQEEMSEEPVTEHQEMPETEDDGEKGATPDMSQAEERGRPDTDQGGDGDLPDMGQGRDGALPDMGQGGDGDLPDMGQGRDGDLPDMGQDSGREARDFEEGGRMTGMEKASTVYLPVGAAVHTDTGKETTFSILEAGDLLEVLLETDENGEEVITEIWMQSE